ncbi:hypothetical protein QUB10_14805 [Microcoleus sp. B5-D4]|uniref:hypothetical protein n=1 Tax=unclassified Microcoleus TaxID=2642155 RepID=UPI002FD70234
MNTTHSSSARLRETIYILGCGNWFPVGEAAVKWTMRGESKSGKSVTIEHRKFKGATSCLNQ